MAPVGIGVSPIRGIEWIRKMPAESEVAANIKIACYLTIANEINESFVLNLVIFIEVPQEYCQNTTWPGSMRVSKAFPLYMLESGRSGRKEAANILNFYRRKFLT